jgi:hypothetical protein
MRIKERRTQTVEMGGWESYWSTERKYNEIEDRLGGFPPKSYYNSLDDVMTTIIWEREWDSFAEMESAYEKLGADPETQEARDMATTKTSEKMEILLVASPQV